MLIKECAYDADESDRMAVQGGGLDQLQKRTARWGLLTGRDPSATGPGSSNSKLLSWCNIPTAYPSDHPRVVILLPGLGSGFVRKLVFVKAS